MNNKTRKSTVALIILITCLLSFLNVSFAVALPNKSLDLKETIGIAVNSCTALKLFDEKINLANHRYQYSLTMSKYAVNKYWITDSEHVINKKTESLFPLQREADLKELEWQKEQKIKSLSNEVRKLYFRALFQMQRIENQKKVVAFTKNEYDISKKQDQIGAASQDTLIMAENSVKSAENTQSSLTIQKDNLLMELNTKLNLNINTNLILKEEVLPTTNLDIQDMNQLILEVVGKAHSIEKLTKDKELVEKEIEILRNYSMADLSKDTEALEDRALEFKYQIDNEKIAIEYRIRTEYNNLLNLKDDISGKKMDYDQATKFLNIAKSKYKLGTITELQYLKEQGNVDESWIKYKQSLLDYYLAVEDFNNYISE